MKINSLFLIIADSQNEETQSESIRFQYSQSSDFSFIRKWTNAYLKSKTRKETIRAKKILSEYRQHQINLVYSQTGVHVANIQKEKEISVAEINERISLNQIQKVEIEKQKAEIDERISLNQIRLAQIRQSNWWKYNNRNGIKTTKEKNALNLTI